MSSCTSHDCESLPLLARPVKGAGPKKNERLRGSLLHATVTLFSTVAALALVSAIFTSRDSLNDPILRVQNTQQNEGARKSGPVPVVVQTVSGPVRGLAENGTVAFLGVPFAKPPVRELRFASPQPPEPWTEVLNTTEFAPGCIQKCELPSLMCPPKLSEDCLYLNVYKPDKEPPKGSGGWPVYVFIHGGSFTEGAGGVPAYNGYSFALRGDIVLVNMNYRLGALGWLAYKEIEGNFGLQDQRLALKWVQDNIGRFGGDKSKVTVGGESAGGISVISHLVSPLSQKLFHKAIIESGPLALPFNQYKNPNKQYTEFVNDANCIEAQYVAQCLRSKSVESLLEIQENMVVIPFPHPFHFLLPWMPTYGNEEIPYHPYLAFKSGNFNKVPLIAGSNVEDGRPFIYSALNFTLNKVEYELILGTLFGVNAPRVLGYYASNDIDNREIFSQLATDVIMTCGARFIAESYHKAKLPAFAYTFGYGFVSTFWGPYSPFCEGHSCHGGELPFVFDLFAEKSMRHLVHIITDELMGNVMNDYWIDFVKKDISSEKPRFQPADASGPSLPDWAQYNGTTQNWMNFTTPTPDLTKDFRKKECDLWDDIGYMYWQ